MRSQCRSTSSPLVARQAGASSAPIAAALDAHGHHGAFDGRLRIANAMLAGPFFFSLDMNDVLARTIRHLAGLEFTELFRSAEP